MPQAAAGLRLEPRDEQLLCDLFLQRLMSREQIERLYFTSTVRCNARLRQLFDHKLVRRLYPPMAPYGAQALYSVGTAALPLIARQLDMDLPEVKRWNRVSSSPAYLEHTLAIVDAWLAFRDALQSDPQWEMETWFSELQCREDYEIKAPDGRVFKEAFNPDGFVRFAHRELDEYHSYFLEIDRGHTSSGQFLKKLLIHERYLQSGLFQRRFKTETFKTLVITTGQRRVRNLLSLVEKEQSELFWFTTFEAIQAAGVLGTIWQRPLHEDCVGLY